MNFDFAFAVAIAPDVLNGIGNTILVTIVSSAGAAFLGFTWEMLRRSGRLGGYIMRVFIDCIRSTPVLVQLYFLFFVLPYYGVTLPAMFVGIFGLSLYFSGYLAEVFKAGIDAIPKGQYEAAEALGLSRPVTVIHILAPQMLRNIAAPMGGYFVSILKATPYLGSAFDVASETYRYAEPMLVAGVFFLALALVVAAAVRRLEVRLLRQDREGA